jgi:hypothetical protein
MSKRINVNPGQYKTAGRERLGEPLGQERNKQRLSQNRKAAKPKPAARKKG